MPGSRPHAAARTADQGRRIGARRTASRRGRNLEGRQPFRAIDADTIRVPGTPAAAAVKLAGLGMECPHLAGNMAASWLIAQLHICRVKPALPCIHETRQPSLARLASARWAGIRLRRRAAGTAGGAVMAAAIAIAVPAVAAPASMLAGPRPAHLLAAAGMGGRGDRPRQLAFSPDGKILATADSDGTARLWNVATERQIGAPIRLSGAQVLDVAFSPDGKVLATADSDGTARLWSVATHRRIGAPFRVSHVKVRSVAFSPDGTMLATGGIGGAARLWRVATRRQIGGAMPTGAAEISQVAFSPNGKILATVYEFSVALWSVATHRKTGKPIGAAPQN